MNLRKCDHAWTAFRRIIMNPERREFLTLANPPARLSTEEAAWFIGCSVHDIAILVAAGLLKPLGHPPPNGAKYFATATLVQLRGDLKWLARASDALVEHWRAKNNRRQSASSACLADRSRVQTPAKIQSDPRPGNPSSEWPEPGN